MKTSKIFGLHAVESLLKQSAQQIKRLYIQSSRHDQRLQNIINLAKQIGISIVEIDKNKLDQLSDNQVHQGVVADVIETKTLTEVDLDELLTNLPRPYFLLVLDGVQDPHNLGACLRSANAAGVQAVIAPKDKSVSITPVVRKVASGAAEVTPFVQVTNLARTLHMLKEHGIWVYGADEAATENIYQTDFINDVALVLGAEGAGLRRLTREYCDVLVKIPMLGTVSDLNVSVAAGICLFEIVRQRGFS